MTCDFAEIQKCNECVCILCCTNKLERYIETKKPLSSHFGIALRQGTFAQIRFIYGRIQRVPNFSRCNCACIVCAEIHFCSCASDCRQSSLRVADFRCRMRAQVSLVHLRKHIGAEKCIQNLLPCQNVDQEKC